METGNIEVENKADETNFIPDDEIHFIGKKVFYTRFITNGGIYLYKRGTKKDTILCALSITQMQNIISELENELKLQEDKKW